MVLVLLIIRHRCYDSVPGPALYHDHISLLHRVCRHGLLNPAAIYFRHTMQRFMLYSSGTWYSSHKAAKDSVVVKDSSVPGSK